MRFLKPPAPYREIITINIYSREMVPLICDLFLELGLDLLPPDHLLLEPHPELLTQLLHTALVRGLNQGKIRVDVCLSLHEIAWLQRRGVSWITALGFGETGRLRLLNCVARHQQHNTLARPAYGTLCSETGILQHQFVLSVSTKRVPPEGSGYRGTKVTHNTVLSFPTLHCIPLHLGYISVY